MFTLENEFLNEPDYIQELVDEELLEKKQENPGKRRERRGNIQTSAAVKWMKFQTAYRLL